MSDYVLGLDLGQAQDYTALSVIELVRPPLPEEEWRPRYFPAPPMPATQYHCRHLERYELRTLYPDIVRKVSALLQTPTLRGATLVIDGTGVGRPVCDMFVNAGLNPIAVTITGGDAVTRDGSYYRVPKRDLVGAVQATLQEKRLKFAESLPLAGTLIDEMLAFKVKITDNAHDTYGSWREGTHDDLILSVMMAVWWIQEQERSRGMSIEELQALVRWQG